MPIERSPWIRIANFATGWEGELVVARLSAERIPARVSGNDLVGLFGPGFQGANARGFFVEVPSRFVSRARVILARPVALPEEFDERDANTESAPESNSSRDDSGERSSNAVEDAPRADVHDELLGE